MRINSTLVKAVIVIPCVALGTAFGVLSVCEPPKVLLEGKLPEDYLWTCMDDPNVLPDGTLVYTAYSPGCPAMVGRARNDSLYYLGVSGDTLARRRLRSEKWTCPDGTESDAPVDCSGGTK